MSVTPEQLEQKPDEPGLEEDTPPDPRGEALVVEDLLIEDVSIDGMCGVY